MSKLNVVERDELLVRVDERTESIIRELKDQNEHLVKINDKVQDHAHHIAVINTTLYGKSEKDGLCKKVETNRSLIIKLMMLATIVGGATGSGATKLLEFIK